MGIDARHGARIYSLCDESGFEWLWSRPDARRFKVEPGDTFVDIGGAEECYPTISGQPDHGSVWARPWSESGQALRVETPDGVLSRSVKSHAQGLQLDYRLEGAPHFPFIWALHALLRPTVGTELLALGAPAVHYWVDGNNEPAIQSSWPIPVKGHDLRTLPADDGTARFAAVETPELTVVAPTGNRLRVELLADGQPTSIGIWRNLGGYPSPGPHYRSFGIEPMLGLHHDRSRARARELARIPANGVLGWAVRFTPDTSPVRLEEQP